MATEIELKAWVEDPEALRGRLSALAGAGASFEKADSYWMLPLREGSGSVAGLSLPSGLGLPSGVRVRRETRERPAGELSREVLVSYKVKEVREGLEINDEREFAVSGPADAPNAGPNAFEELLRRLGLERGAEKHKLGRAWKYRGITAELSLVRGLGWFVELEILADNDRSETVADARSRLLALLAELGVAADRIEPRYYTELLQMADPPGMTGPGLIIPGS
jgi:adenylate cyclase class 2